MALEGLHFREFFKVLASWSSFFREFEDFHPEPFLWPQKQKRQELSY